MEWDEEVGHFRYKGLTPDEQIKWEQGEDEETLKQLGVLPQEAFKEVQTNYEQGQDRLTQKHNNPLTKLDDFFGYTSPKADKEYEKLSVGETWKDIGKAVWNEASKIVIPKQYEKNYEARTFAAESIKYLYRYGAGVFGLGKFGAGLKALQGLGKLGKVLNGAGKLLTSEFKVFEGAANSTKAVKLAKGAGKIASNGLIDGFISDFLVARPEEGEGFLTEGLFPESDNPIVEYFSTNTQDSGLEYRFKHALEGSLLGIGLNFGFAGLGRAFKYTKGAIDSLKKINSATTQEELTQGIKEYQVNIEKRTNTDIAQEFLDKVEQGYKEGKAINELDLSAEEKLKAEEIYEHLKAGRELQPLEDGSIGVKVNSYKDAAYVTDEELIEQTKNDGIQLMEEAVKDTWTTRGLVSEQTPLVTVKTETTEKGKTKTKTTVTGNAETTEKIKNYYAEKWNIDPKKIDIKWSKTTNGQEGQTVAPLPSNKTLKDKQEELSKVQTTLEDLKTTHNNTYKTDTLKDIQTKQSELDKLEKALTKDNSLLLKDTKISKSNEIKIKAKEQEIQAKQNRINKLKDYQKSYETNKKPKTQYNQTTASRAKKKIDKEFKELLGEKPAYDTVKIRYKNRYYSRIANTKDGMQITDTFKDRYEVIEQIYKNPEIVNDADKIAKLEEKLERYLTNDEELTQSIMNDYLKALELANKRLDINIELELSKGLNIKEQLENAQGRLDIAKEQLENLKKTSITKANKSVISDKIKALKSELKELTKNQNLKEQSELAIKKSEEGVNKLKEEIEELKRNSKKAYKAVITIDPNTTNPHAVLRSELEHARDFIKGEKPKKADIAGSNEHFSRYKGDNESEMSLEYVKHKANNRASKDVTEANLDFLDSKNDLTQSSISNENTQIGINTSTNAKTLNVEPSVKSTENTSTVKDTDNYTYETKTENKYGLEIPIKEIKNKEGEVLAKVELIPRGEAFNIRMDNYGIEKGAARKALAELMKEYPDKIFHWEAINEESLKSYKHFVEEYPELADRIKFFDEASEEAFLTRYNGWKYNFSRALRGEIIDEAGSNSSQSISKHNHPTNQGGTGETVKQPSTEQQPIKDNRPINERASTLKNEVEADNLLNEVINSSDKPVITWKVTADNADEIYNRLIARGIDNLAGIKEAISKNDIAYVNMVVSKQLAVERLISNLKTRLLNSKDNPAIIEDLTNSIYYLTDVVKQLSSAYGRGLNAQKFVNKTRNIFSLSTMEEMGLTKLSQLLSVDIESLNFTRGIQGAKQELYNKILKYEDGKFLSQIMNDSSVQGAFDNLLDRILKEQVNDPETIKKYLRDFASPIRKKDLLAYIENAVDDKKIGKIISSMNANGGVKSYMIHNLLSNVGTVVINGLSGVINSVYFPCLKILGSFGNREIAQEGFHQLLGLASVLDDSMQLAIKAFKTGEGELISMGRRNTIEADADIFTGFHAWNDANPWNKLQNVLSVMTRLMGASDEFLTQMNYRAIVQAKAFKKVEGLAQVMGKSSDTDFIKQEIKKELNRAFSSKGEPLDPQAFAEAREMVYQTPLSGRYNKEQIKDQTFLMTVGEGLNNLAAKDKTGIISLLFPFVRTPVNIAQFNLEHNPIYAICSPSQRKLLFSNTKEGARARAKVMFGIGTVTVAYNWASCGLITGSSPFDPKERAALYKTGWKPYSIKVGDKYVSYSRLEPLSTALGMGADIYRIVQGHEVDETQAEMIHRWTMEGMKAIINSSLDKTSFMNGLDQLSKIYKVFNNEDEVPMSELGNLFKPLLPMSSGVQAVRTLGGTQATKPETFIEGLGNKYFSKGLGEYKRNLYGERQDIYQYLIATGSKGLGENPEDKEIERLANLGWIPTELSSNESGSSINYKDFKDRENGRSFYSAMQEELSTIEIDGKTLREAVREMIETDEYQTSPDGIGKIWVNEKDTKKNRLAAIFNQYKKAARNKVIDERGDEFINNQGYSAEEQRQADRDKREEERLNASLSATLENIRSFN